MTPNENKHELVLRMRARELAGTLELIADDAVYFWSDGSAMFGKDAIAEGLKRNFAAIQVCRSGRCPESVAKVFGSYQS